MDRIDSMRMLVAAVDQGSLAAAARSMRQSAARATRLIAALEAHVGTPLLHRTTRALKLSDAGALYVETCRRVLADLDEADRQAAGEHVAVRGTLTLTAPVVAGTRVLLPIVDAFLDRCPDVSARLLLIDRVANLIDEGIDVALRIAHLPDSGMVAVRVGETREVVCAAPAYLARARRIERPEDLADHPAITLAQSRLSETWQFAPSSKGGRAQSIKLRPRLVVNTIDAAIATATAGHGVARLLSYQLADAVQNGALQPILREHEPEPLPIHLVASRASLASAKVRAFIDFAGPRLRSRFAAIDQTLAPAT